MVGIVAKTPALQLCQKVVEGVIFALDFDELRRKVGILLLRDLAEQHVDFHLSASRSRVGFLASTRTSYGKKGLGPVPFDRLPRAGDHSAPRSPHVPQRRSLIHAITLYDVRD